MKKKILAVALAGTLAIGGGALFAGCSKGEDQSKLHDTFCATNASVLAYDGSCTQIKKEDGVLEREETFNHLTGEYARINYDETGMMESYTAIKDFDGELAYYDGYNDKVIDLAYAQNVVKEGLLDSAAEEIELDYDKYMDGLNQEKNEFKNSILGRGGKVNKIEFKVSYKSIDDEKYSAKTHMEYDYELIKNGDGYRVEQALTTKIIFSQDWIYSVEESSKYRYTEYEDGKLIEEEKESAKEFSEYFKNYNTEIYSKLDLSDKTLPEEVEYTYLDIVLDGVKVREDVYLPFNCDVKTEIEQKLPAEEGMGYECYIDEALSIPMPYNYKLNSVEKNTIYVKTVIGEGYSLLTEVYQDTTGIRGTQTRVIPLNEEIELIDFYDYQGYSNKMLIDGIEVAPCEKYTFSAGKAHTIVYIATHNVDEVVQHEMFFYVGYEDGFTVSAGTPSEQTLRAFMDENAITFKGVDVLSAGLSLEIEAEDGSDASLDMKLSEFTAFNYYIYVTAEKGYVFIEGQEIISTEDASEDGVVISFNKNYLTLKGFSGDDEYEYTKFEEWLTGFTVEIVESQHIVTVTITGDFDDNLLYQFYYGDQPFSI